MVINLGWLPLPRFDPTFVILAMFASVETIFLSTFVLINQNRMTALVEKRAELHLQISLLTERQAIGERARTVVLTHHTAERRDHQLETYVQECHTPASAVTVPSATQPYNVITPFT